MNKTSWIILLGIVMLGGCIAPVGDAGLKECSTVECIVETANECEEKVLELEEDIGTVEYSIQYDPNNDFCTLNKKVAKVSDAENPVIKQMFEGKSLTCTYQPGEFNERWVTSLIYDIENCEGDLKESIGQLMVFSS